MKDKLNNRWEIYKTLELIPNSVSEPQTNTTTLARSLQTIWKALVDRLAKELPYEQKLEYLERCWAIGKFELDGASKMNALSKLWMLLS